MAATRAYLQKREQSNNKRKFEALKAESFESNIFYEPSPKRQQTTQFFRPWLLVDKIQEKKHKVKHTPRDPYIVQYHPNKVRAFKPKERTLKEQQQRDKNTLTCLLIRRAKKIEDAVVEMELLDYREQQEDMDEVLVRHHLYLIELLRRLDLEDWMRFNPMPLEFDQQMMNLGGATGGIEGIWSDRKTN